MVGERAQRTCAACHAQGDRTEMLRFVLDPGGQLFFDGHGRLPGRGAYACAEVGCVRRAVERRGFERSFRRPVRCGGPEALIARIGEWQLVRGLNLLGLARRAGRLVAGGDEVARAVTQGRVRVIVLAVDLSSRRRKDLEALAGRAEVPVLSMGTMESLGHAVGRPPTGILAVAEGPQVAPLLQAGERLHEFGGALPAQGPGTLDKSRLEA